MGAWILWALVAAAEEPSCARTFDTGDLADAITSAEARFSALDAAGFGTAKEDILLRLRCQSERLEPEVIARVHQALALDAFLRGDKPQIAAALAGMGAASPLHQLPFDLLPEGHPIRSETAFAGRLLRETDGTPLPPMATGWVEVDGESLPQVPKARAALVQQMDGQGAVVASAYLWPGDSGTAWMAPIVPPPPVKADRASRGARASSTKVTKPGSGAGVTRHVALGVGTGLAVAGTGVLVALASENRATFDAIEPLPGTATAEERESLRTGTLEPLQDRATLLTAGWVAAAVLSAGLGVTLVVTW